MNLQKNISEILYDTEVSLNSRLQTAEEKALDKHQYLSNILASTQKLVQKIEILENSLATPDKYNQFFKETYRRIGILFDRINRLQDTLQNGVSGIEAETNLIFTNIKKTQSLLGITSLYNKINEDNVFYFSDTFTDLTKINNDSSAGIVSNVFVSTEGGVVTAPRQTVTSLLKSNTQFVILPTSTGGAAFTANKGLSVAFNETTDDWAEYSLKTASNNLTLKLNFIVILDEVSAINHIRIEPNNFGTSNWLKINSIKVSLDNINFTRIQDIGADFQSINVQSSLEPDLLLSNYEQKFSKIGDFIFEPVKAKYVLFELEQREAVPYSSSTTPYQYLIGLRKLAIDSITYATSGTLFSKEFVRDSNSKEVGSISLSRNANVNSNSQAGSINFYVSPNNTDWYPISAQEDNSGNEILSFNQPWLTSNIDTSDPVESLYVKAEFVNNLQTISNTANKIILTKDFSEIINLNTQSPYTTVLSFNPKTDVQILTFPYGSVGKDEHVTIKYNLTSDSDYLIKVPFTLDGTEELFVGKEKLYKSSSPAQFTLENTLGKGNYMVYADTIVTRDSSNNIILEEKFDIVYVHLNLSNNSSWWVGENIELRKNSYPYKPEDATETEATLYPSVAQKKIVRLPHYCDGIKSNVKVYKNLMMPDGNDGFQRSYTDFTYILPAQSLKFSIDANTVKPFGTTGGGLTIQGYTEVEFIDGVTELASINSSFPFSVNYFTGEVFLKHPNTEIQSVQCKKEDKTLLPDNYWTILQTNDGIVLEDIAYDSNFWYEVVYQIAIPINSAFFSVSDNVITLTDAAKVQSYLDLLNPNDKLVRATYQYEEQITDPLAEVANYFSPTLKDYTLTCTGLHF